MDSTTENPSAPVMPGSTPQPPPDRHLGMRHAWPLLIGAFALGAAGDLLLFEPAPGIGVTLFAALLVGVLVQLARVNTWSLPTKHNWIFIIPVLIFAAGLAYRTSPWLTTMNVLCIILSLALLGMRLPSGNLTRGGFFAYLDGVARIIGHSFIDAVAGLMPDTRWSEAAPEKLRPHSVSIIRGSAFALAAVLLFGSLLVSADARFERLIDRFFLNPETIMEHIINTGVVTWVAAGFLYTLFVRRRGLVHTPFSERSGGGLESIIVLTAVNILFAVFVVLQLENLFGGMEHVRETTHLTLAQYARRGFFELMFVAALVMPMLAVMDYVTPRGRYRSWVRRNSLAMIALVMVIMASALQRLWLYQRSFGITELRLYTTACIFWLFVVFVIFTATVLTGRREQFTLLLAVSGMVAVVSLNVANPDAMIAEINIARAPEKHSIGFDTYYLETLSDDATPTIVEGIPHLTRAQRTTISRTLVARTNTRGADGEDIDWRSWNWSRSQADTAVRKALVPAVASK